MRGAHKFAECTDLYRDGDREERALELRCQCGTAGFAVVCPFCGTQKKLAKLRLHLHAGFAGH